MQPDSPDVARIASWQSNVSSITTAHDDACGVSSGTGADPGGGVRHHHHDATPVLDHPTHALIHARNNHGSLPSYHTDHAGRLHAVKIAVVLEEQQIATDLCARGELGALRSTIGISKLLELISVVLQCVGLCSLYGGANRDLPNVENHTH